MQPNTIAFFIAPLSLPAVVFLTTGTAQPVNYLLFAGLSYLGLCVFGLPYIFYLEKAGRLTATRIISGSVFFGALFGLIFLFGIANFKEIEYDHSDLLKLTVGLPGIYAMSIGAFNGGIIGVTFSLVRHVALKLQSA